jgi:hypothetical protein
MTLNGTIIMPGNVGELLIGFYDNTAETISGTGTISMGTSSTGESVVDNLSNSGLTIGPGITINAGARLSYFVAERSQTNVQGTVEDSTASSTFYTYGMNYSTSTPFQSLANLNGGTLTGGTWEFSNGATWRTYGVDITTNAANLSISGANTQILDSVSLFSPNNNALDGLASNTATGQLTLGGGYHFGTSGAFSNAGTVNVQSGAAFTTGTSAYTQSGGTTKVDGTLAAANISMNGGILNGDGTIIGNLTNAAVVIPGDPTGTLSIQGDYTQTAAGSLDIKIVGPGAYSSLAVSGTATVAGALNIFLTAGYNPAVGDSFTILSFGTLSGNFASENGLNLGNGVFLVASHVGNDLKLVVED